MRQMPQLLGHLALSSLKVWKLKQPSQYRRDIFGGSRQYLARVFTRGHVQLLYVADSIAQHSTGGRTL